MLPHLNNFVGLKFSLMAKNILTGPLGMSIGIDAVSSPPKVSKVGETTTATSRIITGTTTGETTATDIITSEEGINTITTRIATIITRIMAERIDFRNLVVEDTIRETKSSLFSVISKALTFI